MSSKPEPCPVHDRCFIAKGCRPEYRCGFEIAKTFAYCRLYRELTEALEREQAAQERES